VSDSIVDTRGTHQLADDNTLCAVDHESTGLCHQRKVAHENLMLIDLVSLLVVKSDLDLQRCRISCISFFALRNCVLYIVLTQCKIYKLQAQMTAVISDWRDIIENFFQALA